MEMLETEVEPSQKNKITPFDAKIVVVVATEGGHAFWLNLTNGLVVINDAVKKESEEGITTLVKPWEPESSTPVYLDTATLLHRRYEYQDVLPVVTLDNEDMDLSSSFIEVRAIRDYFTTDLKR